MFVIRHHALESLALALVERMQAHPPADAIQPHRVVVGSRGMERWLRHFIATQLGVCANVEFVFPKRAVADLAAAADPGAAGEAALWSTESIAWALAAELPGCLCLAEFEPVSRYWAHVGAQDGQLGRADWAFVRELAEIFDRYALLRPDWVSRWSAGELPSELSGHAHASWQALLWRRVERRLGRAGSYLGLWERALQGASVSRTVPLHVFGLSSLPPLYLDVLAAVSASVPVWLYAFAPSPYYWGDASTPAERTRRARKLVGRGLAEAAQEARGDDGAVHPLLAALGRRVRDFQSILEANHPEYVEEQAPEWPAGGAPPCLLGWLQEDIRELRSAAELVRTGLKSQRTLEPHDESVTIHACHGPLRQAEVLRDVLMHAFASDPGLEPRDVLVMSPDIATFGPLVRASLGLLADGVSFPVQVSDLTVRSTNTLADVLSRALELASARAAAPALVDLLSLEPVRRRFGYLDAEPAKVREWVEGAGIRWGLDAAERQSHQQPEVLQNTWSFGAARLALGLAVDDERFLFGDVAPFAPVEGARAALVAGVLAAVGAVRHWVHALREPRTVQAWATSLAELLDDLCAPLPEDEWQSEEVLAALAALPEPAEAAGFVDLVSLDAFRRVFDALDTGRAGADRPISGAISACSLEPLRSVPYPVVVLIGLDDGVFPRQSKTRAFDLLHKHPRRGDRDRRDEDRELLLEAVLSARQRLVVLYTGFDPRTGDRVPAPPPLAELLDALDATAVGPVGSARAHVLREEPMHPFSAAAFSPSRATRSYAADYASIARALTAPRREPVPLLDPRERLSSAPPQQLELSALVRWLRRPVRTLLQSRLRLRGATEEDPVARREPVETNRLEAYALRQDAIDAGLARRVALVEPDELLPLWRAQGRTPLGGGGAAVAAVSAREASAVLRAVLPHWPLVPQVVPVSLRVAGVQIDGAIGGVGPNGPVRALASNPGSPGALLAAWVELLVLNAAGAAPAGVRIVGAVTEKGATSAAEVWLQAPSGALGLLESLVQLAVRAHTQRLPLVERTSFAYAEAFLSSGEERPELAGRAKALAAWNGDAVRAGESAVPELRWVWPAGSPIAETEFAELALQVWQPVFASLSQRSLGEGEP